MKTFVILLTVNQLHQQTANVSLILLFVQGTTIALLLSASHQTEPTKQIQQEI